MLNNQKKKTLNFLKLASEMGWSLQQPGNVLTRKLARSNFYSSYTRNS